MGLRRYEEMNKAMLVKLAWRLITEEVAAWCKLLRSKYGLDSSGPIDFKKKKHSSFIWNALV